MVGRGTRSAIERAEIGNSQPKAARASALPDRRRRASRAAGGTDGRDAGLTNRIHETPENCATGSAKLGAKRGVACLVRHWRKLLATEEPDAFIAHVRVCGEGAG
jgi:hypothetical protein